MPGVIDTSATTLPSVPAPYSVRALQVGEAPAVVAVMAAYERRLLGEVLIELEDIQADWQRPSVDLANRSAGVFDGDAMVAYGEVGTDMRCEAFVHPDHWGRGIGTALAQWSIDVARRHGFARVGQTIPDADEAGRALFLGLGYERRHTSWILALPETQSIPDRPLPDGYRLRDFVPGQDEQAAYQVVEDAFNEWEGRDPQPFEEWAPQILQRPGFEPWMLRLVQDPGGVVVGACALQLSDDSGWVHQLAVAKAARGQGLAQALLADAFASSRRHGRPRAELSTDSRTGALSLYEKVGMQVTSSFTHWAKAL
jgi:GNAT superfamily N-acetyltransferase